MLRAEHAVTADPHYTVWAQECGDPAGSSLLLVMGPLPAASPGPSRCSSGSPATVPTLVVEAPEGPINPPPPATHLAGTIGGARLVRIPGMGHALPSAVVPPLADAILTHTAAADARL